MTKGTFGESLKREREMRGVTLEEIAAATRIARRFLQAIENEQWDQLPGGVFNRGFVRAMAHYLGLDEENTVAEYTLTVDDRQSVPVWTGSPPAVTPNLPWLAWIILAVVGIALLAGGWFGVRLLLARHAAKDSPSAVSVNFEGSPAAADAPLPSGGAQAASRDAGAASSASPGTPAAASSPAAIAAANAPAGSLRLKIEASKKTNVTVIADKDVVFDGSMKPGENQSFAAAEGFQVSAEDGGALRLELNGKALAPLGTPGQAGKVTLTREALKGTAGGED
jgi:cytoskeleton protein RodZ